jgi:FkbM family methyltransferase
MALSLTASRAFLAIIRRTRISRLLSFLNVSITARLGNDRVTLPLRGGIGLGLDAPPALWEERIYKRLLGLAEPQSLFLDVGANYGQSFLRFLQYRRVGQAYVGVDPIPECCAYVRLLASRNRVIEAEIVAVALGECEGVAHLLVPETDGSDSSLSSLEPSLRPEGSYSATILVPLIRGDSLLEHRPSPRAISFVKIDVEGFELGVLRGLERTLRAHRPPVLCEVMPSNHPDQIQRRRRADQIAQTAIFLQSLDYLFFHAGHDGTLNPLDRLPEEDWDAKLNNDYDYLFVPVERSGEIVALWEHRK